ncbi:Lipoyltransferase and lipoate-protein ligase, partial [Violaceomyces palustris]
SLPSCLQAYVSKSTDPWFNLAFEDHLFRTRDPETPVCFLYRNDPCVIVGRNQNPWKELNPSAMREASIPLVRRRSGGGTVYHDPGNTNYSFHIPRSIFDRRFHAELVARALNRQPIALETGGLQDQGGAYVNVRNDICVRVPTTSDQAPAAGGGHGVGWEERKVSGSAYKLVNNRAYHHGTMLLNASLTSLGSCLRNTRGERLITKGVASVPSPVVNLTQAFPSRSRHLTHESFVHAVIAEFHRTYAPTESSAPTDLVDFREVDHETSLGDEALNSGRWKLGLGYEELKSWEWTFGQTPEFNHTIPSGEAFDWGSFTLKVNSKEGILLDVKVEELRINQDDPEAAEAIRELTDRLVSKRYDDFALAPPWAMDLQGRSNTHVLDTRRKRGQLLEWLRRVL